MSNHKPKVMLLAAGRGERMRPLTDNTPKPLLKISDETSLIELHIKKLESLGLTDIIINVAWLGDQIIELLGDGSDYGVKIEYSNEGDSALETAGGVINALALLGTEPFIVINSDIITDYNFNKLQLHDNKLAQLVLVPNPAFHPDGDFYMNDNVIHPTEGIKWTFSGIAMYHPDFFKGLNVSVLALGPLLRTAISKYNINAEIHLGSWFDIGTPERLIEIQRLLNK